ncbi:hypothetical protein [Actibacterium sp. 188UL27-1]|uniref:hypothetical protein n=1 Tax=Actibacterium sp. 188UL27-1 TaxID=2786961 RepID=UPI0019581EDC|nr:hypothetical protein [Actibacterium sp. 188UL27-1]MBM7068921.1 hypothetical protein [Actibacterium sp. 188UL27-1]
MPDQGSTEFDERLNCALVLSSSLYFRLVAMDQTERRQRLWSWDGILHDTTRDLATLSDATGSVDARIQHIFSGISDLRHSLLDLADIAPIDTDQHSVAVNIAALKVGDLALNPPTISDPVKGSGTGVASRMR